MPACGPWLWVSRSCKCLFRTSVSLAKLRRPGTGTGARDLGPGTWDKVSVFLLREAATIFNSLASPA